MDVGLLIERLDDQVRAGLQQLAVVHGRTVAEEAHDILRRATAGVAVVDAPDVGESGLGTRLVATFAGLGADFEIPELRGPFGMQVPDFDSADFDR